MSSFYSREELETLGFKKIGEEVFISRNACIYGAEHISIGNYVRIDDFCVLSGEITIGNYIHISAAVLLFAGKTGIELQDFTGISSRGAVYAQSDDFSGNAMTNSMIPDEYRKIQSGKVILEKHVLVGTGSTILPGVTIGEGSSVGSMSLVKSSLESWGIYAGIPCRRIGDRDKKLLDLEKEFLEEIE